LYLDDVTTIQSVKTRKKRDVSVGYNVEIDPTPGVAPSGERYDVRQTKIIPNHVAITTAGRAGTAQIRLDSASQPFSYAYSKENNMPPDKVKENESAALALADALTKNRELEHKLVKETTRADSAEGRVAGLEEQIKTLKSQRTDSDRIAAVEVERDALKTRLDAAESVIAGLDKRVQDGVDRRVKVERGAITVLGAKDDAGKERRFDGMTNREIQVLVVGQVSGANLDDKSNDYVAARFDACVESYSAGQRAMAEVTHAAAIDQKKAQQAARGKQTREDAIAKQRAAWMQPLPSSKMKNA
jgi:hypothetical protein